MKISETLEAKITRGQEESLNCSILLTDRDVVVLWFDDAPGSCFCLTYCETRGTLFGCMGTLNIGRFEPVV